MAIIKEPGRKRSGDRATRKNTRRQRLGRLAYSIPRLASLVGTGRSTLYGEIAAGRLVASKVGRRTIITRENVKAWLLALPTISSHDVH